VVKYCEQLVGDDEAGKQARGKRMLSGLSELRALPGVVVDIDETEIPNANTLGDTLVRLARLEGARLIAGDHEIAKRALAEGVSPIDLNVIAACMAPKIGPGDTISLTIDKAGEGKGQGVGFLDDGSMVIVGNAADAVGQQIRCTVMRMHTTANGRMVFAERARP
jgi:uncharacterized protein YacL